MNSFTSGPEIEGLKEMHHSADLMLSNRGRMMLVHKRLFDLMLGGLALILLAPVIILAAGLVLLSSPGPVLFRPVRIGLNGQPFVMFKSFHPLVRPLVGTLYPKLAHHGSLRLLINRFRNA